MVVTSRPLPDPAVEASNTNSGARAKNMRPVMVSSTAMALALSAGLANGKSPSHSSVSSLTAWATSSALGLGADGGHAEAAGVQDQARAAGCSRRRR